MVVLDANLLLEILEKRHFYSDVVNLFERYSKKGANLAISTLTISNTFYLAEKHKIPTDRVEKLIAGYKVFSVLGEDVDWALQHYKGQDFEDALQIASAVREECAVFVTLDKALAKKYSRFLRIELI